MHHPNFSESQIPGQNKHLGWVRKRNEDNELCKIRLDSCMAEITSHHSEILEASHATPTSRHVYHVNQGMSWTYDKGPLNLVREQAELMYPVADVSCPISSPLLSSFPHVRSSRSRENWPIHQQNISRKDSTWGLLADNKNQHRKSENIFYEYFVPGENKESVHSLKSRTNDLKKSVNR